MAHGSVALPQDAVDVSLPPDAVDIDKAQGGFSSFLQKYWDKVNPVNAVKGVAETIAHPIEATKAELESRFGPALKAEEALRAGNYTEAASHALHFFVRNNPLAGPQIDDAATAFEKKDYSGGAATLAAQATQAAVGALGTRVPVGKAVSAVAEKLPNINPTAANAIGMIPHPIPQAIAHGLKILGRIQQSVGSVMKEAPAVEEAAPAAEASRVVIPEESASTPRSPERQAIVDELNKQPGKVVQPSNTITTPEAAQEGPPVSAREAVNRSKLAQDLAEFLHSNGEGISHEDALRMGPDQWKLARSAVRQTGKASTPSPATVQLALEHLKELEAKAGAPAKVVPISGPTGPQMLQGKSLDIAQRLAREMGQ